MQWVGDSARGPHLDAVHLGRPRRGRGGARPAARQGARDLPLHGRRLRLEERRRRLHVHRGRAREAHRPARSSCALTRREENVAAGNRNATIQRLTIGAQERRHADRARRRVRQRRRLGRLVVAGRRADADALRVPEREDDDVRREDQPAADEGVPRARASSRGRSGSRRCSTSSRRSSTSTRSSCGARTTPSTTPTDERPFSSKNLLECYRRAEPHWERRHEVRARSTDTVKRGVGMASQIWYGGGGPPSYAWIRVGSDGRATVVTAMQDIGTGTKTAMAQIAAEELGIPLEHVTVSLGDSGARAVRVDLGRLVDDPVDGAGRARRRGRREAPDHRDRRAALRPRRARRSTSRAATSSPPTATSPHRSRRWSGCSKTRRSSARARAGRTRPGMQVLTFGVQVAEVAVDVETGEVWVDRIAADPRRRPRDQPARRVEPDRGRDHPGHRPHALRGAAARSAHRPDPHDRRSTPTSCRRSPTCRRSSASWSTSRTST